MPFYLYIMEDTLHDLSTLFNKFLIKISYGLEGFKYQGYTIGSSVLLINFIHANPFCRMSDIRDYLEVTPSTATRRVDRLVEYGFVHRSIGDKDHRSIELSLTPAGVELFEKFQKIRFQGLKTLTNTYKEEEIKNFLSVLKFFLNISDQFLEEKR